MQRVPFMPFRSGLLIICSLCLFDSSLFVRAQEVSEETALRVRTRVVSLDALVKDKRTGRPVTDLKLENFTVLADGQPRKLTYFTREGDVGRKPLALALVFDLERLGAGRFLRRTDILAAMANELDKLPPADEVAVIALDPNGQDGKREWLTKFTRSRAQLASALAIVPTLVGGGAGGDTPDANTPVVSQTKDTEIKRPSTAQQPAQQSGATKQPNAQPATNEPKPDDKKPADKKQKDKAQKDKPQTEGEVIDEFKEKDGHTVRRILKPDGQIVVERTNANGSVTVELDDFELAAATWEINRAFATERPDSQAAIVYVTDSIAPIFYAQRDFIAGRLVKTNTIFSALVVDMKTGFKLAMPILKPLGNWVGLSIAGSAQYFARQTGGEVCHVHAPEDYARGLAQIVGNLTARYSLGFTLATDERADGQMHPLEVRITAKDAKGHERNLIINARKGYYMPKNEPPPQTSESAKTGAQ